MTKNKIRRKKKNFRKDWKSKVLTPPASGFCLFIIEATFQLIIFMK